MKVTDEVFNMIASKLEILINRMDEGKEYPANVAGNVYGTNTMIAYGKYTIITWRNEAIKKSTGYNWDKVMLICNDIWKQVKK